MGLRDDITADIAEAFDDDLADAVQAFTGTRTTAATYDPVTEETTGSEVVTYNGRGVFGEYESQWIDGISILRTDVLLTALKAEVDNVPLIDDEINEYRVISVGKDPADVTWSIQLRKA